MKQIIFAIPLLLLLSCSTEANKQKAPNDAPNSDGTPPAEQGDDGRVGNRGIKMMFELSNATCLWLDSGEVMCGAANKNEMGEKPYLNGNPNYYFKTLTLNGGQACGVDFSDQFKCFGISDEKAQISRLLVDSQKKVVRVFDRSAYLDSENNVFGIESNNLIGTLPKHKELVEIKNGFCLLLEDDTLKCISFTNDEPFPNMPLGKKMIQLSGVGQGLASALCLIDTSNSLSCYGDGTWQTKVPSDIKAKRIINAGIGSSEVCFVDMNDMAQCLESEGKFKPEGFKPAQIVAINGGYCGAASNGEVKCWHDDLNGYVALNKYDASHLNMAATTYVAPATKGFSTSELNGVWQSRYSKLTIKDGIVVRDDISLNPDVPVKTTQFEFTADHHDEFIYGMKWVKIVNKAEVLADSESRTTFSRFEIKDDILKISFRGEKNWLPNREMFESYKKVSE